MESERLRLRNEEMLDSEPVPAVPDSSGVINPANIDPASYYGNSGGDATQAGFYIQPRMPQPSMSQTGASAPGQTSGNVQPQFMNYGPTPPSMSPQNLQSTQAQYLQPTVPQPQWTPGR